MQSYVQNYDGINYEEEGVDFITLEDYKIEEIGESRKHIFLKCFPNFLIYDVETLYELVIYNETNNIKQIEPSTRRELSENEIKYIKFHYEIYSRFHNEKINKNLLLREYFEMKNKNRNDQELVEKARLLLKIEDFYEHFKNYEVENLSILKLERTKAETFLNVSSPGSWVLRHSSCNRPKKDGVVDRERMRMNKLKGFIYYALSFKDENRVIKHVLLKKVLGEGWFLENNGRIYFVCFIDILDYLISNLRLDYVISRYL